MPFKKQALPCPFAKKDHTDRSEDNIEFEDDSKILDIKEIILELFERVLP